MTHNHKYKPLTHSSTAAHVFPVVSMVVIESLFSFNSIQFDDCRRCLSMCIFRNHGYDFLVANKRLYKRLCPSVSPSVRPSVRGSVGPWVRRSRVSEFKPKSDLTSINAPAQRSRLIRRVYELVGLKYTAIPK